MGWQFGRSLCIATGFIHTGLGNSNIELLTKVGAGFKVVQNTFNDNKWHRLPVALGL